MFTISDSVTGRKYEIPSQEFDLIVRAAQVCLKDYIMIGQDDALCRAAHEHTRDMRGTFGMEP